MNDRPMPVLKQLLFSTVLVVPCTTAAQAIDLGSRYPARPDDPAAGEVRDAPAGEADVWRLASFTYAVDGKLGISSGPAALVLGTADSTVRWAAVLPDEPARFSADEAGVDGRVQSIWIRCHPSLVPTLFPTETIAGSGPLEGSAAADSRFRATRLATHKMRSSFHVGGRPSVPPANMIVIDMETVERPRRFVVVDTAETTVRYFPQFEHRVLPPARAITPEQATIAFDKTWSAFDREYAMFTVRPDVDWAELRAEYRGECIAANTDFELAYVLAAMLAHLEDLHVNVRVRDEYVAVFDRERPMNASPHALDRYFSRVQRHPAQFGWARTDDGIGYVNIWSLGDDRLPDAVGEALETLGDTWALIIDLRMNGGGDETLAQRIAGRFLDRAVVYSASRYRNGPAHDDLTPAIERICAPRGPWRYRAPVIVLQGRRTMSSAESFVLMLAQAPQVTTMGDHTAGSSGNPRQVELPADIVVTLPRWLDLKPDGTPLDRVGATPDVWIEAPAKSFTNERDPVLEAALERLRGMPDAERRPGRAD